MNIKKTLVHLVCVIMFILIQFDVCGYDFMRACQLADKPTVDYISASDSCLGSSDDSILAWTNPAYRGVRTRSLIKAPFKKFSLLAFCLYQRELPFLQYAADIFQAKLSALTYLRLRVLLI